MIKWTLILSYLVAQSPSTVIDYCPDNKPMCVQGAQIEELGDSVTESIVMMVYRGETARKDCAAQAVRFAEGVDDLPKGILLRIGGRPQAETYTCRGVWE